MTNKGQYKIHNFIGHNRLQDDKYAISAHRCKTKLFKLWKSPLTNDVILFETVEFALGLKVFRKKPRVLTGEEDL